VSSWGSAQQTLDGSAALPDAVGRNATVRQVVRTSLAGRAVRVRLSNVFGTAPLVVHAASIALAQGPGSGALQAGSLHRLQFDGRSMATVAAGAELLSDPVDLPHGANADLAISLYVERFSTPQTGHAGARATSFVAAGNRVADTLFPPSTATVHWYQLTAVESLAVPCARSVVVIGDSITDGFGVGADSNTRWTDYLAGRLRTAGMQDVAVINAGIGGGRLLRDGVGPSVVARFARDVLQRPGVSHAIVLAGVNDLGGLHRSGADTSEARERLLTAMQQAYRQLVAAGHARGVCVLGGTIGPYGASTYYRPSPDNEADRLLLNRWIRESGVFDGVVDVDAALRDPARPDVLLRAYDNDGLHPSIAGYQAMARAVSLASLTRCAYALAAQARP
jgi:lysophospholipase L1-like esterase